MDDYLHAQPVRRRGDAPEGVAEELLHHARVEHGAGAVGHVVGVDAAGDPRRGPGPPGIMQ